MPEVTLIRVPELWAGVPYAYAATSPAGARTIHLAGSCPLNADGSTAAVGDVRGQARKCLENMGVALRAAGAGIEDVIFLRALVASTRREDLGVVWEEVRSAFGDHDVPGTLFGVTVLGWDDQLVEIEATAVAR